jgi:hypothetical protein
VERKSSSPTNKPIFKKTTAGIPGGGFLFPHAGLQRLAKPKTRKTPAMNTTKQDNDKTHAPQYGGNSVTESESLLAQLFHRYLEAGLQNSDAWDAALADYAHGFNTAA